MLKQWGVLKVTDTPCPWTMQSQSRIDAIPYARITDIDFSAPKQPKRGAHLKINSLLINDTVAVQFTSQYCDTCI